MLIKWNYGQKELMNSSCLAWGFLFVFKIYFSVKGRIRDIKIFYLLVQSLNGHNGQRWAGSKPGARNFVSHVGAGFPRGHTGHISRELDWRCLGPPKSPYMGCSHCRQRINWLCHGTCPKCFLFLMLKVFFCRNCFGSYSLAYGLVFREPFRKLMSIVKASDSY